MAKDSAFRGAAKEPPHLSAIDALAELEGELHDAINMSDIARDLVDASHARRQDGYFLIGDEQMRLLAFAVNHASRLVDRVKKTWDETWDKASAQKGGAA